MYILFAQKYYIIDYTNKSPYQFIHDLDYVIKEYLKLAFRQEYPS